MTAPAPTPRRRWTGGHGAVAVGGLLRLWVWIATPVEGMLQPDSGSYLSTAERFPRAFFDGTWFSYRRTPGYPAFLSLFDGSPRVVTFIQVIVSTATIGLVLWWVRRSLDDRSATAAAWVVAVEPATIIHSSYVLTETLFTAVLVSGVVLLWAAVHRARWWLGALAGLTVGLSALVRPGALYLVGVLAIVVFAMRTPRVAGAFLLVGSTVVGGWIARNVVTEDLPSLSIIDSGNMLYWRGAGTLAALEDRDPRDVRAELIEQYDGREWVNLGERWRFEHETGREIVLAHPVAYAEASFLRFGAMLAHVRWTEYHGAFQSIPLAVTALIYLCIYCVTLWGLPRLWRADRVASILIMATVGYFIVLSFAPEVHDRFRVPFWPFVAVAAGAGWARLRGAPEAGGS